MKLPFSAAAAVLAAGLLAACQSGNESVPAQQTVPVASSTYTERTTTEVTAAGKHATEMAPYNYFGHTSRDGSAPWDR